MAVHMICIYRLPISKEKNRFVEKFLFKNPFSMNFKGDIKVSVST